MPTDEEMRQAQQFIRQRIEAERAAVSNLDAALLAAARRIIDISRKYNIPPDKFRFSADKGLKAEVAAVLAALRALLYDEVEDSLTFDEGDDTFTAPALTAIDNGKTFRQRLADYTSRWGYELEATIAAAGMEGITDVKAMESAVKAYLGRPYDNPWIKEHTGEGDAVRLRAVPHYGKGKPIASERALALLLTTVIAKGRSEWWAEQNAGKRYYYVFRGSSYPCELCDSYVGYPFMASDRSGLPPYHNRCCCYAVYTDTI